MANPDGISALPAPRSTAAFQAVTSFLLVAASFLLLGTGCAHRPPPSRYEFSSVQMAIPFRIVLYSSDPQIATNAARAAWKRIAELNRLLSDYDPDSELSRLGASSPHAHPVQVSADLYRVIERACAVSAASDGAFDLSVGPLTQLWRRTRRQRELPEPEKLRSALAATDWKSIELHPKSRVRLTRPGMRLDAGGIAKGYALDEATRVLRAHGIRSSLVAGSGDMVVTDPPPGQTGWRIQVAPLELPGSPPARFVSLHHASLCTSGDVFQHVEIRGIRYSHILDPRTGLGLTHQSLITVIGPDGITTDALSTAISVAGPRAGIPLARRFGAEVLVVRQSASGASPPIESFESPGFARWTVR